MNSSDMMLSLLPMLWAFVLTMACGTAWLGTRHNARLEERYGLEVEALKSAARSSNTVLATYLWRRTAAAIKAGEASRTSTNWSQTNVVYDGSLHGGDQGSAEIVSPPLIGRPSLRGWVRAVSTAIAGVMRIDSSCGLHTHIGLRDPGGTFDNQNNGPTSPEQARNLGVRVAVMYYNYLRAFHSLVSPSRRHNHYGGMQRFNDTLQDYSVSSTWDHTNSRGVRSYFGENWATRTDDDKQRKYKQAFENLAFDRYVPVNLTTVNSRGTIEFRLHQGTINANKMYAWAHLHYLFVAACMDEEYWWQHLQHLARRRRYTANHDRLGNLNDLLSFVGLSESDPLANYLQARARYIAGEGPEVPSPWMPSSEEAAANTDLYRAHVAYETRETTHPLTTREHYINLHDYLQHSVSNDDWDDWDGETTERMSLLEQAFGEDLRDLDGATIGHYDGCPYGLESLSLDHSLAHSMHTAYWNGPDSAERDYQAIRVLVEPTATPQQFTIDVQYRCRDCGYYTTLPSGTAQGYDSISPQEPTFPDYDPNYMVAGAVSLLMGLAPWVMALGLAIGCGIGAIHKANNRAFPKSKWFVRLHNALTSRGRQAAGWTISDGKTNVTDKRPVSAHALAKNTHKAIRGNKTVWGMMHTRYATHGVNNSDNAHPHFGPDGHVTMVHNGVVHNHDKVWNGLGLTPTGPVDSQAVAAALEVGGINKVVELCEGSMSLIWNDRRDADHTALHWWTNGGNPLAFGRLGKADGPIVVGSTIEHLKTSFGKHLHSVYDCVIGRHYRTTESGSILSEDIAGSAATAYTSYDWRTYSSLRVNTDKGKSAATCEAPHTWDLSGQRSSDLWSLRGLTLKQHITNQYDSVLRWGERGWAPGEFDGDRYDGYDAHKHAGVVQDPVSGDYYEYYLPSNVHPDPYDEDNLDWEWVALGDFRDVLADDIANNEPESLWVWDTDPYMTW
jgi:hypothetical protein